jgi:hypothetical protein
MFFTIGHRRWASMSHGPTDAELRHPRWKSSRRREAGGRHVASRSWSHPQQPTTEEWWADVLADPRAQIRKRRGSEKAISRTFYRLADGPRDTILVACSKCDWKAAFRRDELLAAHGAACPMPSLLVRLAAPGCPKIGSQWDCCGVHYVDPIEGDL